MTLFDIFRPKTILAIAFIIAVFLASVNRVLLIVRECPAPAILDFLFLYWYNRIVFSRICREK